MVAGRQQGLRRLAQWVRRFGPSDVLDTSGTYWVRNNFMYMKAMFLRVMAVCVCVGTSLAQDSPGGQASETGRVVVVRSDGSSLTSPTAGGAFRAVTNGDKVIICGRHRITPGLGNHEFGASVAPLELLNKTNVIVQGEAGAEIVGDGPGDFLSIENSEQVRFEGITFRGNRPAIPSEPVQLFSMILLRGTNAHLSFVRCRFVGFGDHAISQLWGPKTSRFVTISECEFVEGGSGGVPGLGADGAAVSGIGSHWRIAGNRVIDCVRGFEMENAGSNTVEVVDIVGNTLTGVADSGVMLFSANPVGERFTDLNISGNNFKDFLDANGSATAISLAAGKRVKIQGNIVHRMARQGIALASVDGALLDVTMADNLVSEVGNNGIAIEKGAYPLANLSVVNNRCSLGGEAGIRVTDVADAVIAGNVCYNNGLYVVAAGLEVAGTNASNPIVRANTCYDTQEQKTQDYGIWIKTGVNGAVLRNNVCLDSRAVAAGLNDEGEATDFDGDKTSESVFSFSGY